MGSRIAATLGRQLKRSFKMVRFLVENGYLKFVPVVPIYWATEQYWYRKGLADGIRRYGGDKKLD